jgi:hypothetical protein
MTAGVAHPAPYTGDIEIRIHGVSGTPPAELLDRGEVRQVAGDRIAGFYRPAVPDLQRDRPSVAGPGVDPPAEGPWLEGYSWGGWTSGARSRALWLALAPFALANVAPRMLPPDPVVGERIDRLTRVPPATGRVATERLVARQRQLRRSAEVLLRVIALSLTVTMVLGVTIVSLVTVGSRCAGVADQSSAVAEAAGSGSAGAATASVCHGLPTVLIHLLQSLTPALRLLVMAIVPVVLVGALWLVSRRSSTRYQTAGEEDPGSAAGATGSAAGATGSASGSTVRPEDDATPLARPDLWRNAATTSRLRLLHVQVGLLSIGWVLAWLLPSSGVRTGTLWLAGVAMTLVAVLCGIRPSQARVRRGAAAVMLDARLVWLPVAGVLAGCLVLAIAGDKLWSAAATVDPDWLVVRADHMVEGLFVGQAVLLIVVGMLLLALRAGGSGAGMGLFMGGYSAFFLSVLAWLLGSMLTASVLILVPAWLATTGLAFSPGRLSEVLQQHATWFGDTSRSSCVGMLVGVAILVVIGIQLGVRAVIASARGGATPDRAAFAHDYPGRAGEGPLLAKGRARSIGFIFWAGRRVDRVPRGIVVFCLFVAAFLILQLVALLSEPRGEPADGATFAGWMLGHPSVTCSPANDQIATCPGSWQVAWGAWLTAGLLVAVVAVGVLAYRTRAARRGVGVLWDLACFWPRDVHPLAPPCYNERIIPEVTARVDWYVGKRSDPGAAGLRGSAADGEASVGGAGDPRGRVVIAGHSQGTVISVAVVMLIQPETRQRVALLTFGCVLDRLYARFYPRYFGPDLFGAVGLTLHEPGSPPRWSNLWRHSDFLGGAVPYPAGLAAYPEPPLADPDGPDGDDSEVFVGDPDPLPDGGSARGGELARPLPGAPPGVPPGSVAENPRPALGPWNVMFVDPPFDVQPGSVLYPPAGRHSGFWLVPQFQQEIDVLVREIG